MSAQDQYARRDDRCVRAGVAVPLRHTPALQGPLPFCARCSLRAAQADGRVPEGRGPVGPFMAQRGAVCWPAYTSAITLRSGVGNRASYWPAAIASNRA